MAKKIAAPSGSLPHTQMTVAVLGSGGREHALAWKIAESALCKKVYILPGNSGMAWNALKKLQCELADLNDHKALIKKLKDLEVEFVLVGPDNLLSAGVVDALTAAGFLVFGPTQAAARIEWSKAYAKEVLSALKIPTAKYELITKRNVAKLSEIAEALGGFPLALKYDGLALGKGVQVCVDEREAKEFLNSVFEVGKFTRDARGIPVEADPVVVAEQFLMGHEISLFAVTDGNSYALLEPACDYKKLLDGDRGPNTGGMGAYSPVPWISRQQVTNIGKAVFPAVLQWMREKRTPFKGLLYAGLMVNVNDYWVLEFNARFGDPETQAIIPRLESDLLPLLVAAASEKLESYLDSSPLRWSEKSCVTIVAASSGYPESPITGRGLIKEEGLDQIASRVHFYFSGVRAKDDDYLGETSGGRVFSVSALGTGLEEAQSLALSSLGQLHFEGMQYRKDVGRVRSDL